MKTRMAIGLLGPNRFVSEPLNNILQQSDISPVKVYTSATAAGARGGYPILRAAHPLVRRMRLATGLDIVGISARYRRLLVDIEQYQGTPLVWLYREMNASYTSFRCKTRLPGITQARLLGASVSALTDKIPVLASVELGEEDDHYPPDDGWLQLKAKPRWIAF